MSIQNIRGTVDILPDTIHIWQWIEKKTRNIFKRFNFCEIRTPVFESTDLFLRTIGEGTDIVTKEMYTFADKKGRSITLRPEGTASIVRAMIQHKLIQPNIINKVFYIGPMFRYERPQAGRQRQFHQIGIEVTGSDKPEADIETISLLKYFFEELGIKDVKFRINSTGSRHLRENLNNAIKERVTPSLSKLCPDCHIRYEKNVLRIYDCKVPSCKEIIKTLPGISFLLSDEDKKHFEEVKSGLDALQIEYEVDDRLVRGLDYYTRTIYEAYSDKLGAQDAIAGGGRYDNLFEDMGAGYNVPSVGFAIGIERVVNLLLALNADIPNDSLDIFAINAGCTLEEHLKLVNYLRNAGYKVDYDILRRSVKAQFRAADKLKAKLIILRGSEEIEKKTVKIKVLETGKEIEASYNQIIEKIELLL